MKLIEKFDGVHADERDASSIDIFGLVLSKLHARWIQQQV